MDENDKYICKGFAQLLINMLKENVTEVILDFSFANCKAKFKIELIRLTELKEKGE